MKKKHLWVCNVVFLSPSNEKSFPVCHRHHFLSFILSPHQVTSNMHDYLHKNDVEEFDYDINHLLHAASVLCSYAFGLPLILWVTTQCMNMQALLLVEWVCLYGYSLVPFLPAVVLCIIPFGIVSWIFLLMATIVSCSLIVRNVAAPLLSSDVGQAKAPPVLLAILGTHIIFFLFLKFSFYHHTSTSGN